MQHDWIVDQRVATFKIPLIAIKTKSPNQVWSKSWLFDPIVWSDWILDHLVGYIFPFKTMVHGLKLELKRMKYQHNTKTLIKCFTFFQVKQAVFGPNFPKQLFRLGNNWSDPSKLAWSMRSRPPLTKRARWYLPWIWRNNFFKEKRHKNFPHYVTSLLDAISWQP